MPKCPYHQPSRFHPSNPNAAGIPHGPRRLAWSIACALAVLALAATDARAWNHTGHRLSALMAWRELTPDARAAATAILRAHPRYQQDLLGDLPAVGPAGKADPDEWAFMTAATWPDIIRDRRHPMNRDYHKSAWHYVDYAYAPDGDRRGYVDGTSAWEPGTDPANVLQALAKVLADLRNPATAPADRAVALCWYLHLAGDLHQPLHASSRVSADLPKGDKGGNDTLVRDKGAVSNLHAMWDGLLGRHADPARLSRAADAMADDFPKAEMGPEASPADPDRVAAESRVLAATFVHLGGALRSAVAPPFGSPPPPAETVPEVPPGYAAAAAGIARRRVAQAGYRMGEELSRALDPQGAATRPAGTRPASQPASRPGGELLVPVPAGGR
jgi:hypothetical protein